EQGNLPGAEECLRRAVESAPKDVTFHNNLASILLLRGNLAGAAACYQRVIELTPKDPEPHLRLGFALLRHGAFRAARGPFEPTHDRGPGRKDWRDLTAGLVKQCDRFIKLESRLPAILKGEDPPQGAECLDLAELCHYKRLHASSVRLS